MRGAAVAVPRCRALLGLLEARRLAIARAAVAAVRGAERGALRVGMICLRPGRQGRSAARPPFRAETRQCADAARRGAQRSAPRAIRAVRSLT